MIVKIFGERHTATNAVACFVTLNFDIVHTQDVSFLGWKHRRAPEKEEWMQVDYLNTLFIFTVRNPYTWLKSMYRQPYYYHHPEIKELPFEEFLLHPVEDYRNILCMWNEKYSAYLKMCNDVPNGIILRVEDFNANQQEVYHRLKKYIQPRGEFQRFDKYVSGEDVSDQKTELISTEPCLSSTEYKIVGRYLDSSTVREVGYKVMPS